MIVREGERGRCKDYGQIQLPLKHLVPKGGDKVPDPG